MATFPIQYSKASPSGEVGAVQARPVSADVRTGAVGANESYAQSGAQFANLGENLMGLAFKIIDQQDSLKFSQLKRQVDEMGLAAYNSAKGDFEVDSKTWQKFEQDAEDLTAKGGRVGVSLQKHINEVMPEWKDAYDKHSLGIMRKNVHDGFVLEAEHLLGQGNMAEYYTQLNNRLALEDISQAEYDILIERAPNDSILQQMRLAVGNGNPQGAIALSGQLKDATADQLEYVNTLKDKAVDMLNKSNESDKLMIYEKSESGELTREDVWATSLNPDDKIRMWENYKQSQAEKRRFGISMIEEGDPVVLAQVYAIVDLKPNEISEAKLYELADKGLGTKHIPHLITRLRQNLKSDNPVLNKYRSELTRVLNAELLGKKDKRKTSDTYLNLSVKLETFLATNPTDQQAQEFFSSLIREDIRTFGYLGENALPGFGDNPLTVDLKTKAGEEKSFSITYGDTVEVDGEILQAVGRKDGVIQWRTVKRQ